MNIFIGIGRLVRDPEVKYSASGTPVATFTLAINRPAQKGEEAQADFLNCVCFSKSAELVGNYVSKGQRLGVEGSLRVRSYEDKNGQKRSVTEVLVNRMEFVESKNKNDSMGNSASVEGGFASMGDVSDIPF
jgi:single-strand DNA-binding protein